MSDATIIFMFRSILFLLFCLTFPTDFARAIPPPDLIISASQAVFTTVGIFLSFIFVWWTQLRTWLTVNKRNKYIFFGVISTITLVTFVFVNQLPNINNIFWRKKIDKELQTLWFEYEPVYSAESEMSFRDKLIDSSRETTWDNFTKIVGNSDYIVVDIRESYGYKAGHIPGSISMRFGDLINGEWQTLLKYKDYPIYIVCYVGSTGALTIDFLTRKGFTKLYQPKGGIMHAIKNEENLPFEGTIVAPGIYKETHSLTKYDAKKIIQNNDVLTIDLRSPSHYQNKIDFFINYRHFRELITTEEIKVFLSSLDPFKNYLLICDSELSCYQGEMLYQDLDRLGVNVYGVHRIY